MPTLNLGQVRPVYRGAWTSIDTYSAYDFVIYNGSAYLALKDVPANYEPPSQTEYWVLFGAKGDTGAPGQDGVDGEPGERGPSPGYRWDGTFLSIQNPDGTWPDQGINLQGPPVPLSNSVTSTSETDAASSLAAKTAYDRGSSGITAAETAQFAAETAQFAAETAQSAAETAQSAVNTLRTDVPLIAANAAGPSDKSIDISFTGSTTVIAPEDGYYSIEGVSNSDNGFVYIENKSNKIKDVSRGNSSAGMYVYLYVSKGNSVFLEAKNCTSVIARFVYTNGNAPA